MASTGVQIYAKGNDPVKFHYNRTHWAPGTVVGDADSTFTAQWALELLFLELGVAATSGSLFSP